MRGDKGPQRGGVALTVAVELDVADCEARALIWRVAANAGRATRRARDIIAREA